MFWVVCFAFGPIISLRALHFVVFAFSSLLCPRYRSHIPCIFGDSSFVNMAGRLATILMYFCTFINLVFFLFKFHILVGFLWMNCHCSYDQFEGHAFGHRVFLTLTMTVITVTLEFLLRNFVSLEMQRSSIIHKVTSNKAHGILIILLA